MRRALPPLLALVLALVPVSYTHLQVLQRLVGGPVRAHGDPRVGAAKADLEVVVAHGGACLLYTSRCV